MINENHESVHQDTEQAIPPEIPDIDTLSSHRMPLSHNNTAEKMQPRGHVLKIPVTLRVILGSTKMPLSQVMKLEEGSIVTLDNNITDPILIEINGNEVARGKIVIIDEKSGQLGVTLTHVMDDLSQQTP